MSAAVYVRPPSRAKWTNTSTRSSTSSAGRSGDRCAGRGGRPDRDPGAPDSVARLSTKPASVRRFVDKPVDARTGRPLPSDIRTGADARVTRSARGPGKPGHEPDGPRKTEAE